MASRQLRKLSGMAFVAGAVVLAAASVAAACTSYVGKVTVDAAVTSTLGTGSGSHTVEGDGANKLHGYCVNNEATEDPAAIPIGTMTQKGAIKLKVGPGTSGGTCNTVANKLTQNNYLVRYAVVGTPTLGSWCNPNSSSLGHLGTLAVDSTGTSQWTEFKLPTLVQGRVAFCVVVPEVVVGDKDPVKNGNLAAPELRADVRLI